MDRTHEGQSLKLLVVVDEYSRECLAIEVQPRLTSQSVQEVLGLFFFSTGVRRKFGPIMVQTISGELAGVV